jgi:hypothetical protein
VYKLFKPHLTQVFRCRWRRFGHRQILGRFLEPGISLVVTSGASYKLGEPATGDGEVDETVRMYFRP